MSAQTVPQLFLEAVETHDARNAFRYYQDGTWVDVSHRDMLERVHAVTLALEALNLARGDRVAIISENRLEWAVADLAIMSAGLITVPLYATLPSDQCQYILQDSEARAVFVSGQEQLAKLEECRSRLPKLLHVFSFDDPGDDHADALPFAALIERGRIVENKPDYAAVVATVGQSDWASIIYTSGTTARPKGVVLSHGNFVSNVRSCLEAFEIDAGDSYLSMLPLSHSFERTAGFFTMMYAGCTICYARSFDTVMDDMHSVSPTIVCSVPRLYEKLYAGIMDAVESSSGMRRNLFNWAVEVGRTWVGENRSGKVGVLTRGKRGLADALVFRKLRKRTGGRLRFFISGGAALSPEIAEFFHAAGIPILEGYGLTEASPVIAVNSFDHFKFGTVGRPLPGVEVAMAEDGELLARGDNVMQGYYKMPEETAATIRDGWLLTGDIGHIDDDGYVVITDRKKDIIVTAGGKNIAPQVVEGRLKDNPYISEAVLVGNKRRFVSVVIVPDFERLEEFAGSHGVGWDTREALVESTAVRELYTREIESSCGTLASFEQPKKFIILPREFSIEEGELTPSLKVKRRVVEHSLEASIDALYLE
jgi:long-chain acyl-CoA synthetase